MWCAGCPKKRTFIMLLEPQCTGSITSSRHPFVFVFEFVFESISSEYWESQIKFRCFRSMTLGQIFCLTWSESSSWRRFSGFLGFPLLIVVRWVIFSARHEQEADVQFITIVCIDAFFYVLYRCMLSRRGMLISRTSLCSKNRASFPFAHLVLVSQGQRRSVTHNYSSFFEG